MRTFTSDDGRSWIARLYDHDEAPEVGSRFGWEAILFEPGVAGQQSLAFRPAGWLLKATTLDLLTALQESEWVRTRWGVGQSSDSSDAA